MPRHGRSRYEDSYSSGSSGSDVSRSKYKHKSGSRSGSRSRRSKELVRRRSYSKSPSRYSSSKRKGYKSKEKEKSRRRRSTSRSSKSSTSRSKQKYSSSKKSSSHRSSRTSSSHSSSPEITVSKEVIEQLKNRKNLDDTESKIEKAIKAAEAAGLTMCKLPSYEYKEVEVKEEMPTIQDRNVLDELNSETFVQKPFASRSKKKPQNIVIDLNAETIRVPVDVDIPKSESLFHDQFFLDETILQEKWFKELLSFRRRAMRGDLT